MVHGFAPVHLAVVLWTEAVCGVRHCLVVVREVEPRTRVANFVKFQFVNAWSSIVYNVHDNVHCIEELI